jgi:hypothetical protein
LLHRVFNALLDGIHSALYIISLVEAYCHESTKMISPRASVSTEPPPLVQASTNMSRSYLIGFLYSSERDDAASAMIFASTICKSNRSLAIHRSYKTLSIALCQSIGVTMWFSNSHITVMTASIADPGISIRKILPQYLACSKAKNSVFCLLKDD